MAITIRQWPRRYSPVYNDLSFICSSDNTDEVNFNYVFDLYVSGTFHSRHFIPSNPDNGLGRFNPQRIIESFVTHDIDKDTEGWAQNNNSWVSFLIKVGEMYNVDGVTTVLENLAISNPILAYNGSLDYMDFIDYDDNVFALNNSSKRFLTNAPGLVVRSNDKAWLHLMTVNPNQMNHLRYTGYSSAGVVQTAASISNPFAYSSDNNLFLRVGCGPWNIKESVGSNALDGVAYYTVQVRDSSNGNRSAAFRFDIDDSCTKYEIYRLHFLNKLGGFDSFNFTRLSRNNLSIDRKEFIKPVGIYTGNSWGFSKSQGNAGVLGTSTRERVTINSNWITEEQAGWLEELITSPIVFQERDGELLPVKILTNSYEKRKTVNDKIFNLTLDFEYQFTNYRQRY